MRRYLYLVVCLLVAHCVQAAAPTTQQLIVIRHGQAMNNVKDAYSTNPLHANYKAAYLTQAGRDQISADAKQLLKTGYNKDNIEAVYVSPLTRTFESADLLVKAGLISRDHLNLDPRLIAVQMGDLEGRPIIKNWKTSDATTYHTETDEQVDARIRALYGDLLAQGSCGHIIVITHGTLAQKLIALATAGEEKNVNLSPGEFKVIPLVPAVKKH